MPNLTVSSDVDGFMAAADQAAMRTAIGLGSVNNTADTAKPVSTATQTALDLKAPLVSPTFTGTPAAPTASPGTNNTQIATTAFTQAAINALVDASPGTLNTLNELAAALGDDPNFATTILAAIAAVNDVNVFPSLFDVTGVKAGDLVIITGDKAYRATGPSSFVPLVADPTSHTHPAYLTQPLVMPATAMAALAIDYTKYLNTKTITGNATMTFVAGTPASWVRTDLNVHNNVGTASTLTIPSCYSYVRNALITSIVLPADSHLSLSFVYTGTRWEVFGDPVATSGSVGKYVLLDDSTPPIDGQVMKWVAASGKWVPANDNNSGGGGGGTVLVRSQDFRLSTETGVSVSITDRTAQSTIYLTPHGGNQIALYDGSAWQLRSSAEISLALSGLTSGRNYDVFAYWSDSAVVLELSAAWTNDTTRADAITRQNGIWCKTGALTRRLVGTIRTTGTTTTEDSAAKKFVWNVNNQVNSALQVIDNSSHTYNSSTARYVNGSAANRMEFVCGLPQSVAFSVAGNIQPSVELSLSLNWTSGTPVLADTSSYYFSAANTDVPGVVTRNVPAGYAFLALLEAVYSGTPTITKARGSATTAG
jgi:hypothetical protein